MANISHSNRAHAVCSASGADRGLACLGSVAMCAKVPTSKSSKAALEGTSAHELSDKMILPLINAWNKGQGDTWDELTSDYSRWEDYPQEMWEHCLQYNRVFWDEVVKHKPKKIFSEQKLVLSEDLGMFGTADRFFGYRDEGKKILSVWDFKFGRKYVVEPTSWQLKYYASCVAHALGIPFDEALLNIYQPRAEHVEGSHRTATVTYAEIQECIARLLQWGSQAPKLIGKSVKELEPHLLAGKHCEFCDGQTQCPAFGKMIQDDAGLDFMDDPDLLLPATQDQNREILSQFEFDGDRAAKFLATIPKLRKFCNMYEEASINYIQSGGKIPGHKVVRGNGRRGWKSQLTVIETGLKELGIEEPCEKKLPGLGVIETKLRGLKEINGVKVTAKTAKALIEPFTVKSEGSLSLVPNDDPRPAIEGSDQAGLDFAGVSDESEAFD